MGILLQELAMIGLLALIALVTWRAGRENRLRKIKSAAECWAAIEKEMDQAVVEAKEMSPPIPRFGVVGCHPEFEKRVTGKQTADEVRAELVKIAGERI